MAAAARDAEISVSAADRIGLNIGTVGAVPVETPLLDIAVHVVQPPVVRRCFSDVQRDHVFGRFPAGIPAQHRVLVKRLGERLSRVIRRRSACPAGILPLGLGGQSIRLPFLLAKPPAEGCGFLPRHEDHRLVVVGGESQLAPQAPVLRIELLVLGVGYLGRADEQRLADDNLVRRTLVPFAFGRAHDERARLNANELHAQRVGDRIVAEDHALGHRHQSE